MRRTAIEPQLRAGVSEDGGWSKTEVGTPRLAGALAKVRAGIRLSDRTGQQKTNLRCLGSVLSLSYQKVNRAANSILRDWVRVLE